MTAQEVEETIKNNQRLVYSVINKYFSRFCGDEDIVQVGRIGLWKACIAYDSSKSKFSTFATHCIVNEIREELRSRRTKLYGLGDVASLDEPLYFDRGGNAVTLAHIIPDLNDDYCAVDYDVSFLEGKLSKRDVEVFKLSIYGFTAAEIGRAFGYTRAWASRIIKEARTICKAKMPYT